MNEYSFDLNTHIGGWYIPEKVCDDLINYFLMNPHRQKKGMVNYSNTPIIDNEHKESLEISISPEENFNAFIAYRENLQKILELYMKKYTHANEVRSFNMIEECNIQYYKPNQGFKKWHFENGYVGNDKRFLTFMTYLNTLDEGGTEFLYQNLKVPANKGLTIIWPTDWTHTHKGVISKTQEKYIITGWFSFYE